MSVVVRAEELRKSYGGLEAVRGVDLCVENGECFGFLGPNGAGKTSVMKMIYCVSPVTGGQLSVLGLDVMNSPREVKGRLGVAPQNDNLDPDLSVLENLTVYSRYHSIPMDVARRRSLDLLDFMHLSDKADVKVESLSGGMKRRLIIARALINEPEILILDEPTTGLDPQARHIIWERIRELKHGGTTVLLTTHYMDEAEQLCDRLVIMDQGRVLMRGTPRELIREVVGARVVEVNDPEQTMDGFIEGQGWKHERVLDHLLIYTNTSDEVVQALRDTFGYQDSNIRNATLEDVFLMLTGRGLIE